MKIKSLALLCALALGCSVVWAAPSLQEQLAAVAQAESIGQVRQEAKQAAEEEARQRALQEAESRRQRAAAAADARHAREVAASVAKAKAKAAAEAARAKAAREERLADKQRDQAYEDQLREVELMKQKMELMKMEARAKRENDVIDAELKREAAKTDVIQSDADAQRAVSTGAGELMKSEGRAREAKAGKWFN